MSPTFQFSELPQAFSVDLLTKSYDQEADYSSSDNPTAESTLTMLRALYWQNIENLPHPAGYPSVEKDIERSPTLQQMSVGQLMRVRLQWKADTLALRNAGSGDPHPFPSFIQWCRSNGVIPKEEQNIA